MPDLEWLRDELCHTPTESRKMTNGQPLTFSLKADAALPLGSATARFEVGFSVEDGKAEIAFQVDTDGPLPNLAAAATESANQMREQRAVYSGGQLRSKKTQTPTRSAGRGRRDMRMG
jgi:hypothetical protein